MSGIAPSMSSTMSSGITPSSSVVSGSNVKTMTSASGVMPSFSSKSFSTSGITGGRTSGRVEERPSGISQTPAGYVPTPQLAELEKNAPRVSFNVQEETEKIIDIYEKIITQKMYAELVANMIGHEKEAFEEWAESLNIKPTEIRDLEDFIGMMATNSYSTDPLLNDKITKVLEYIPDIIQSLTKAEGVAPAIKVLEGKNPIVDEAKFTIEKIVSPLIKRIGTSLEKRFTGETGKQIARLMVDWGEKLATLPSKILERIGPYDIMASVLDLGLLAVDQATGNYRSRNHDLPEELLSIPVIGSVSSALMSVRDLLDTALGVPTNKEGVDIIQKQLYDNLWNPSMAEYREVIKEIGGKEQELKNASEKLKQQVARDEINLEVQATMEDAIDLFEGDKKAIEAFYNKELGLNFNDNLPTKAEAQSQYDTEKKKLDDLKATLKDFEDRYAETQFGRPIQSLFEEVKRYRELVNKQQAVVNSKQTLLNQATENDKNRQKIEDIRTIIDLYMEEMTLEEAERELIDIQELTDVEEVINPIEIQGRTILENLFTMGEQLRIANGAISSLEKQIRDYDAEIYEASVILRMRDVPYDTLILAQNVKKEAERKKPLAEEALRELEASLPEMEEQTGIYQDELEALIEFADEEGIDLSFLEQSTNFDEALSAIQDDSKIWEKIFGAFGALSSGFNPYMF